MKRPFELVAEIQEKDAEIKRLKAQVARLSEAQLHAITLKADQAILIIELCDALGAKTLWLNRDDIALLQRAREATR